MYKIIGADGKEYGPITQDQLRAWITEGRANAQTKVLGPGAVEWKSLSEFPEFFSASVAAPPPQPFPGAAPLGGSALEKVNGPALGLMILAGINLVLGALALILNLVGASFMATQNMPDQAWASMYSGTIGIVSNALGILVSGLIFFGGLKMKRLESHGLAVTASILAMLPCTSPCCIIGLPLGIWALVVLSKPEVKSAFR
jgi:hypothetical protein